MDIRFGQVHKFHPSHYNNNDLVIAKVSAPTIPDRFELAASSDREHPSVLRVTHWNHPPSGETKIHRIEGHIATSQSTVWDKIRTGTLLVPVSITLSQLKRPFSPVEHVPIDRSKLPQVYEELEKDGVEIAKEWERQQTLPQPSDADAADAVRTGLVEKQNAWYQSNDPNHPKRYSESVNN